MKAKVEERKASKSWRTTNTRKKSSRCVVKITKKQIKKKTKNITAESELMSRSSRSTRRLIMWNNYVLFWRRRKSSTSEEWRPRGVSDGHRLVTRTIREISFSLSLALLLFLSLCRCNHILRTHTACTTRVQKQSVDRERMKYEWI